MLEARNIRVVFDSVVALNDVSVGFPSAAVHGVIGPNGSGKSTLFNAITGFSAVAGGEVRHHDALLTGMPTHQRIRAGVGRTFQTPRFDPAITVQHAVLCGFYPKRKSSVMSLALRTNAAAREEQAMRDACELVLRDFCLEEYRDRKVGELPMGIVRIVEVARAVANEPSFLLLDEPAAGLTTGEQAVLATEIRRLARRGVGVVLVEHNFELICDLVEHVTVLDRGEVLTRGTPAEIQRDDRFVRAYLGSTYKRNRAT